MLCCCESALGQPMFWSDSTSCFSVPPALCPLSAFQHSRLNTVQHLAMRRYRPVLSVS